MKSKKSIEIKSRTEKGFFGTNHIVDDSHYIYAVDNKGDTLGKLNIVCNETREQKIVFVYVKHDEKKGYRTDIQKQDLINYVNTYSHNQLFIGVTLDNDYLIDTLNVSSHYATNPTYYKSKILDKKLIAIYKEYNNLKEINAETIVFFITDIEVGDLKGWMLYESGLGLITSKGSTKVICHELGHGVSLPHPFCCNIAKESGEQRCIDQVTSQKRCNAQGATSNNYMDYLPDDKRNMYFFYQWVHASKCIRVEPQMENISY